MGAERQHADRTGVTRLINDARSLVREHALEHMVGLKPSPDIAPGFVHDLLLGVFKRDLYSEYLLAVRKARGAEINYYRHTQPHTPLPYEEVLEDLAYTMTRACVTHVQQFAEVIQLFPDGPPSYEQQDYAAAAGD